MSSLRLALLQTDIVWHNPEANRKYLDHQLELLKGQVDIVVLPEMFTTGFTMEPKEVAEDEGGSTVEWMLNWAFGLDALLIGSIPFRENDQFFNRLFAVSKEDVQAEYNKRHLFHPAGEHLAYQAGKEWVCFEYKGWRICPQICYDLRFPVWSRNRPMQDGSGLFYDLLLYIANWPEARISHWDALLPARAIENQAYVAGVNRVGTDKHNLSYPGHSGVWDFMGKQTLNLGDKVDSQVVTLDLKALQVYREKFAVWKDADAFDLYL